MTSEIFDRETAKAWGELEGLLTEYLETTPTGRTLLIEMPSPIDDIDGASPYVQLTIDDDGFRGPRLPATTTSTRASL